MSGKLKGRRALVTGGGQGLGLAISMALIEAGCDIAIHYFSSREGAESCARAAEQRGQRAASFQADLTEEAACKAMVNKAAAFLGGIDILINNAGDLLARRELPELNAVFWKQVHDINITSMVWVTQSAVSYLAKAEGGASIVNLASLAGRKGGHAGSLAYSTAKGAVLAWTRALSTELGSSEIRVNALAPGLMLGTRFHDTHTTEASAKNTVSQIPLGRAGTPEDVARAAVFLASEYDGFITGATLDINGGVYCA